MIEEEFGTELCSSTRPTTVLRVRRRRAAGTAMTLRLEGVVIGPDAKKLKRSSDLIEQELVIGSENASRTRVSSVESDGGPDVATTTAVWRRVSDLEPALDAECDLDQQELHQWPGKKRSFLVVDAILEDDESSPNAMAPTTKRRRLTILPSITSTSSSSPTTATLSRNTSFAPVYPVLTPLERLVDDSLSKTITGETSLERHYDLCTRDARLVENSRTWLTWGLTSGKTITLWRGMKGSNHSEGSSNLLHACALWNGVEIANQLLAMHLPANFATARDENGQTPYQIAQMAGHEQICQILQAYGVDTLDYDDVFERRQDRDDEEIIGYVESDYDDEDDDDDYVVDLYCLDSSRAIFRTRGESSSNSHRVTRDNNESAIPEIACQLHGGLGYWDDNGHLIFCRDDDENDDDNALIPIVPNPKNTPLVLGGGNHYGGVVDDDDDFDDEDSNGEDWAGNDYPDEDYNDDDDSDGVVSDGC